MSLTDPAEHIEKEGLCPECRNEAIYNKQTGWYECQFCDWTDISLAETFVCEGCGEIEVESEKAIIDGMEFCRDCQKLI